MARCRQDIEAINAQLETASDNTSIQQLQTKKTLCQQTISLIKSEKLLPEDVLDAPELVVQFPDYYIKGSTWEKSSELPSIKGKWKQMPWRTIPYHAEEARKALKRHKAQQHRVMSGSGTAPYPNPGTVQNTTRRRVIAGSSGLRMHYRLPESQHH